MKIFLLTDFFLSGQTTHLLELARQLKYFKIEVFIAFRAISSPLFYSYYAPALKRSRIPFCADSHGERLYEKAKTWGADLIHCHSSTLFESACTLSLKLDIPYLLTLHGLETDRPSLADPCTLASALIAVGPKTAALISDFPEKTAVIKNGVDLDHFTPPKSRGKIRREVIYMGRLDHRRLPPLIELIGAHYAFTGTPLKIVSNCDPRLPKTQFIPWQPDPAPFLKKTGIVAACGRTAREALSSGNAVLLLQQSYDGVITPGLASCPDFDFSGNGRRFALADLSTDLQRLLGSSERLKGLQIWGRSYALQHLSSETMAKEHIRLYKLILHKKIPSAKMG